MSQDSAAAAIIIEQAIELSNDTSLRETASDIALEREKQISLIYISIPFQMAKEKTP